MKSMFKKRETPFIYHKYYCAVQDKWTAKMSNLTEGLSKEKLIFLLVFFTALSTGYFLYNIYNAFSSSCPPSFKNLKSTSKIKTIP